MRMTLVTQMKATPKAYRILIKPETDFRIAGDCMLGGVVDRLGEFEDIGLEPDELAKIVDRYKRYKHLFAK